ncbi:MAG: hypothetical protein RBS86_04830 [Candidatus Moranbacteria bacterium]|jgi:hypothetical protein|nr:hypothetical protein [Candidatus Moranbacteria bacterium]
MEFLKSVEKSISQYTTDDKVFLILFALEKIHNEKDWLPFEDLVLNNISHPAQNKFLKNSDKKENVIHPGNGWGKTSVLAKKHIFFVLSNFMHLSKYKTLNVAITQDQAELVHDEIVRIVQNSPILSGWFIKNDTRFPSSKIVYASGAITEFKTTKKKGESIEGKEYGYISADEIALELHLEFLRDHILLPRLRKWRGSQIDFSATPKGRNAYFRVVEDIKRKGGYVQGGSSYDNPHTDHSLYDYQLKTWTETKANQVIFGQFVETSGLMFSGRVDKLFDNDLTFQEVLTGHKYIEGWDLARGKNKNADSTVGFRIDIREKPFKVVKRWSFQLPWTEKERENIISSGEDNPTSSIEREIRTSYYESNAEVYIDSTGIGDTLFGILKDIANPVDFRGGNKDKLLENLQAVIDAGLLKCPYIPELADEMTTYDRSDVNLPTDNIMGLAVACSAIPVYEEDPVMVVDHDILR